MYRLLELLADRVVADIAAGNYLTPVLFIAGGVFLWVKLIKANKNFACMLLVPIVLLLSPILIPLYLIAGKREKKRMEKECKAEQAEYTDMSDRPPE